MGYRNIYTCTVITKESSCMSSKEISICEIRSENIPLTTHCPMGSVIHTRTCSSRKQKLDLHCTLIKSIIYLYNK